MRPLLLVLLALLFLPVLMLNRAAPQCNETYQELLPPSPAPPASKLTMDHYRKLVQGMNTVDVTCELYPAAVGTEVSSAGSLETREYRDGDRFIIVTFNNGQLVAKAQFGL